MSVSRTVDSPDEAAKAGSSGRVRTGPRLRRLSAFLLALAAPGAFALNPAEKPANYIVTRWNVEDGLPHNSVRQLYQSRDGYLWVGTTQGLARFDGLNFTIFSYPVTPGLPNSQVTALTETSDGSLWIGTANGLAQYRDGHFTSYSRAQGLKTDTINALCVAPDGSLWIGGRDGITRWVNGKFINDIDTTGYDTLAMRQIIRDHHNVLWITIGTEVLRYADGKFTRLGRADGLPMRQLQMIREDPEGQLLAVAQDGLYRLVGKRFVPFEQNSALSSPRTSTAYFDRAGNLWIGSVGGLDRYADGKLVPYVDAQGKNFAGVDTLFEDREGCLWVGTSEGLARFTDRRAYTIGRDEGIRGSLGGAVLQSRDGSIWISSWAGGVARLQHGTVRQYADGAPLSHESTTALYEAPDGTMWFGNRGSALDHLDGEKVTTYVYPSGVATSRPVTAIDIGPDGEFLLGISRRGLLQLRDGKITPVPETAALAGETVWAIHHTRDGRLLLGTTKGLFQRTPERAWVPVKLPDLGPDPEIRAFLEEDNGVLWLATAGHGLVRYEAGRTRAYGTPEGMIDNTLYSVLDDGNGSFWVGSARGIARVRKAEIAELDRGALPGLNCMTLGRVDGLLSGAVSGSASPSAALLADGRLLMATDRGIAVIDPRHLAVNTQPPNVVIESVIADDKPLNVAPGRALSIPAGTNRLEIRYTALSLVAPQWLRFRYQLQGSDTGWIEAGRTRSANYTHLSPGPYTFRVLACNNDGVWTKTGASLALTIEPRFFQTLWFRIAMVVLFAASVFFVASSRVRQLKRRQLALSRANAELERRVEARTAELAAALQQLRNEVAERERGEAERRLLDRKIEESQRLDGLGVLAGGVAHDFNNILAGIMLTASLARIEVTAGNKLQTHLQAIEESAARAAGLCEQLLLYAGQSRVSVQTLDLNFVMRETLGLLRVSVPKDAEFSADYAPALPVIKGDAARLRQVLVNLVLNAAEALGAPPRRIRLATHRTILDAAALQGLTHPGAAAPGVYAQIEVSDTGAGIPPDKLGRIFEPFYTTKFIGRGLGLSAVLGIVRTHGGALDVRSESGRGTTFRVYFPGLEATPVPGHTVPDTGVVAAG